MAARKTFLSILRFLVPSWLYDEVTKSHAMIVDEHLDRVRAGLEARMPSLAQPDANALTGDDRGIPRGRTETDEHYARRLIGWRYPRGHVVRGSAFALLNQVSEYFGGIWCWTIDVNYNRHDRTAEGEETFVYSYPWPWGDDPRRALFWVVIEPGNLFRAQPSLGDPTLWGGALGLPGYSIGQIGALTEDADAMRALFTGDYPWKPAGALQQWLVVNLDGTIHTPDETWANWSVIVLGTQVKARYEGWRYWALYAPLKDYAGLGRWCTLFAKPDGFSYGGVETSWPATITLPNGNAVAGSNSNFPLTITLPDDGDKP